jgi:hypothetical protein
VLCARILQAVRGIYSILYLLVWLFHSIKIGKVGEMVKVPFYDTTFLGV